MHLNQQQRCRPTIAFSCPDKSESLGFPIVGMKFETITLENGKFDNERLPADTLGKIGRITKISYSYGK